MKRITYYSITDFIKDNIESVELPYFDTKIHKYILKANYSNIDMSVGTYASDLGTESIEYEFSDKFKCWGMYKKIKEQHD